jgi:glutamyl-tRNA synthetase
MPVRTRFAPSPSGHLHVGGARTALFCWAYARGRGGKFLLRIEDTDRKRSSAAATAAFMDDLAWLGIDWDEGPEHGACGGGERGPYLQSQRLALYREHADRLIAEGKAYRAFETPEELAAARAAAEAEKRGYRYDRAALGLDEATVQRYLAEKRPHVVRFKLPEIEQVSFHDDVRGDIAVGLHTLDDFVIVKADGYPIYHFAVVIDDELMGVSHVIRGEEHLYNTARHVLLQEALGFKRPVFAHVSLIFNPDGSKMSKRERDRVLRAAIKKSGVGEPPPGAGVSGSEWARWLEDKDLQLEPDVARRLGETLEVDLPEIDVEDFRRAGYLPEVMINYLALLGWSPAGDREKFDRAFFVEHFDFDRVIKSPARFDREKLRAFNLDALQALTADGFTTRLREHGERYHPEFLERLGDRFETFAACNHERSKTLEDPFRDGRFFVIADDEIVYEQSKAVRKAMGGDPAGIGLLEALVPRLEAVQSWTVADLERTITGYAEERAGGKLGRIAQPLRIAVAGRPVSPAIFDTLFILGRERVLARVARCLATIGKDAASNRP